MKKVNLFRLSALMLVLVAALAASSQTRAASVITVDGVSYWPSSDSTAIVINQINYMGDGHIVIQPFVTDGERAYKVTEIIEYAFQRCSVMDTLVLPNTLKVIGKEAFEGCRYLRGVVIPNSVVSIGEQAFGECSSLENLVISESLTEISRSCFSSCEKLKSVHIPNSVETIGSNAFYYCNSLEKVNMPTSIKRIERQAFLRCKIDSLRIPATMEYIADNAFTGNSNLRYISVDPANPIYDSRGDCHALIQTATNKLMLGCVNTVIPNDIETIGSAAFASCTALTGIDLPSSVKVIGNSAFAGCSSLTTVTFPESVERIGGSAFYNCSKLATVNFNSNLQQLGDSAFMFCSKLAEINLPNSLTHIGSHAFHECDQATSLHLPDHLISIGDYAFYMTIKLTEINFPSTLQEIGNRAFWGDNLVSTLELPESLTRVDSYAFLYFTSVNHLRIPKNVSFIDVEAFSRNKNLESIEVDPENPYYDSRNGCNAIIETATGMLVQGCKNTVIPNGVTGIGEGAFNNVNLTAITIPETVSSIGKYAFADNQSLMQLIIPDAVTEISDYVFYHCGLKTVDLGTQVTRLGWSAFGFTYPSKLYVRTMTPPAWANSGSSSVFSAYTGTVYVPGPAVEAYKANSNWGRFNRIFAIPGEISGDGKVDIDDVTVLISMLLDSEALPAYADVNGDGSSDIDDVIAIISMLLGQTE